MEEPEAAAILYAVTPEEFIGQRKPLVDRARREGNRELAKLIGSWRRPTRSAWLINLLAREAPADLAGLLELGPALRTAQSQGSGGDLRRLSAERARLVGRLTGRAVELGARHGHTVTEAQRQEVAQHLQAALADPGLAEDVRAGRVSQIVTVGGFGPWPAGPPLVPAAAVPSSAPDSPAQPAEAPEAAGPSPAEREVALRARTEAAADLAAAERDLAAARSAAQAARAEAERLRALLAAARSEAEAAGRALAEQERRVAEARARLAAAKAGPAADQNG